jgi:hypothetical protein
MTFFPAITIADCFWGIIWGWYYSAFAFFFAIIFSIILMKKKSIASLIMLAHCYWIMFFLYGMLFLSFFGYIFSNNICCDILSYNLVTSCFIAVLLFFAQIGVIVYIRYFYKINLFLIGKTLALSGLFATFFVYCIAKTFIV